MLEGGREGLSGVRFGVGFEEGGCACRCGSLAGLVEDLVE